MKVYDNAVVIASYANAKAEKEVKEKAQNKTKITILVGNDIPSNVTCSKLFTNAWSKLAN